MKTRYGIFASLAAVHLLLVVLGAAQVSYEKLGTFGKILADYSALSGASSGYGFFAPGVGTHLRAVFEVGDAGKVISTSLQSGKSRESDLRVGNIIGLFWDQVGDERLRRSLAASWSGKVLGRYSGATDIALRLESYDLPSMADYRQGTRGGWEPFYNAKFLRKAKKGIVQ